CASFCLSAFSFDDFIIKKELFQQAEMNCTPIVRHSLTIGGAVFLWLNLQLMKKYKSFYVI
ncbi:hypothetical protein P9130_31880, partial [Bacillus thuringiensis]|uniref:hypothetical protein n=1 Tax=Bacillus thuringiensis TaxID=1428 RepID=UPI002DBF75AC